MGTAQHPLALARPAFVRAIEEGQALAEDNPSAARVSVGKSDHLPGEVTAVMALPDFPVGPVDEQRSQRTADAMLPVRPPCPGSTPPKSGRAP